jgi:NAD+--asparagine ADP-ribosyltransferase
MTSLSASPIQSSGYMDKVKVFIQQFPQVLDDFKKAYIQLNMNPSDAENQSIYNKYKSTLDRLNDDLINTFNELENKNNKLIQLIQILNNQVKKEKDLNSDLNFINSQAEGADSGSSMLIENTKDLYRMQRISNINMLFGVGFVGVMLFRVFRESAKISQ